MRFDPSGLTQAFDRLGDNAAKQGKTLAEVMGQTFLADMKAESRQVAPTPELLVETAKRLKWRLRRKKGVSPGKELARRIRARKTFARGWKFWKQEGSGLRTRIWLIDTANQSGKVDDQKHVSDKAEKITGRKYRSKLDTLASKLMGGF